MDWAAVPPKYDHNRTPRPSEERDLTWTKGFADITGLGSWDEQSGQALSPMTGVLRRDAQRRDREGEVTLEAAEAGSDGATSRTCLGSWKKEEAGRIPWRLERSTALLNPHLGLDFWP